MAAAPLTHVEVGEGDAEHLDFADHRFDAVCCASALFFLPHILEALRAWQRVLRPGGRIAFSVFGATLFQPMRTLFTDRIQTYGVSLPPRRPSQRLTTPAQCQDLLQEAGFHPLEVIRGATLHGAQALFEPKGKPIEFGVVRPGLLADLVIVPEDPVANLKVLYGTGAVRLNEQTGKAERVGGIRYTIKDGIVYDARKLLADVARMVEKQKQERGLTRLPAIEFP